METELQNTNAHFEILLVDDCFEDRVIYRRVLEKDRTAHFNVDEAESVEEGLRLSLEKNYDCILLDYNLKDATGIEFIQAYQKEAKNKNTAIIMVTGEGDEKIAVESMKLGILDYITKNSIQESFFIQNILKAIERARIKEELEQTTRDLSDFTHTVSHDLKAPLRRILSYCEMLEEELGDNLSADATNYMNRMSVNTIRLQKLIDDLLSYTNASYSKEVKEDQDIKEIVSAVIEDLSVLIKENNATVTFKDLPVLSVYPSRIRQLFQNLISNALKYRSDKDPVIQISCEDKDNHYLFSIKDNGLGIDEKFQKRVFGTFERLHTQDKIEGSGLGLSICQKAVEIHQGEIWVKSIPNEGSCFFFTLSKI